MPVPLGQTIVSPLMVGRAAHLEQILSLIEQAPRNALGAGRVLLVSGEAGIGKSRLVAETERLARERGLRALKGHCFETDRSLPYAPLLDLLRGCLVSARAGDVGGVGPEWQAGAPEMIKILPELSALLGDVTPSP